MSPALAGLFISGLAALGTVLGVLISGVGKRGDRQTQEVNDQFSRQLQEISYWRDVDQHTRAALAECLLKLQSQQPHQPERGTSEE